MRMAIDTALCWSGCTLLWHSKLWLDPNAKGMCPFQQQQQGLAVPNWEPHLLGKHNERSKPVTSAVTPLETHTNWGGCLCLHNTTAVLSSACCNSCAGHQVMTTAS